MTSNAAHDRLEQYLLGTLPETEREQIDERILTDSQLFDDLCIAENELAYDYAIGLLSSEERRRFEARFLNRPAIRARVHTATALLEQMRTLEQSGAPWRLPWQVYAAAAASVVLVAWLARDNLRLRSQADSISAAKIPAASSQVDARPPAVQAQTEPSKTTNPPLPPESTAPLVVSMSLQPGVVRSNAAAVRVRLAPGTSLRLQLSLPATATAFAAYRAVMRTPEDTEVWSGTAQGASTATQIAFTIPGSSVPPNDYEITLYGVQRGKDPEEIANYTVSVLRQ